MSTNDIHGIEPGWKVKSLDGSEIGTVEEVDERYLLVTTGLVSSTRRYLPSATLAHVRPEQKEVSLDLSSEEVEAGDWSEPPAEGPRSEGAPLNANSDAEVEDAMRAGVVDEPERSDTL